MAIFHYKAVIAFILISLPVVLVSCFDDPVRTSIPDEYLSDVTSSNEFYFASSNSGQVYKSSDGKNWSSLGVRNSEILLSITSFQDSVLFTTGENGVMLSSSNYGEDWRKITTEIQNFIKDLAFIDDTTIVAAGEAGTIILSEDFGETWTQLESPSTFDISVLFVDNGNIYCGTRTNTDINEAYVYRSTDRGENWQELTIPDRINIGDINIINDTLFICTENSVYTTDRDLNNLQLYKSIQEEGTFVIEEIVEFNGKKYIFGYEGFNLGKIFEINSDTITEIDYNGTMYFLSAVADENNLLAVGGNGLKHAVFENGSFTVGEISE